MEYYVTKPVLKTFITTWQRDSFAITSSNYCVKILRKKPKANCKLPVTMSNSSLWSLHITVLKTVCMPELN